MRKALFILMCLVAMSVAGTGLEAQEVTIMLKPGWTWISYPSADTVDFATALGTFTPRQGDVIACEYEYSEYYGGEWVGDIQQFYPGYGYMYYSTRNMPVLVTFNAQPPAPQVVVTTDTPQLITGNSAMGGGNVVSNDGTYIIVKGLCWAAHENPTTNEDSFLEEGSGVGSFTATMTGLNWSTTYYYRAYVVTPNGTLYGDEVSFTTRDGIPTLTTTGITDITGASATSGGNITDNGGLNITGRGVCWSTSPNPTIADSRTSNGSGSGSFSSSITGLNVSTTYYVRAYATTNAGTGYGDQKTFTTRDGIAVVTTAELTRIGLATATCGGTVTDDGGLIVTARGVCWSTECNPTIADMHSTDGSGVGSFSSTLTRLIPNTTYYVRAYATNSHVTVYGNELSFITDNPSYVDLGLPSGLLWATCDVGADNPEGDGYWFAWGETQIKYSFHWSTYQYCNGSYNTLTKYCNNSSYGYNGFVDNLTTLLPEDDAATANWGDGWRMPTIEEWQELDNYTTHTWKYQNGVYGRLFTASNGNKIFLPAHYHDSFGSDCGDEGYYAVDYWSSSLVTYTPYNARRYYYSECTSSGNNYYVRYGGRRVRPVRSSGQNISYTINATASPEVGGEVNGGGTYQEGAECTLTATANAGYTFANWTENGSQVSSNATYTFTVNADRSLVANFTYNGGGGDHAYVDLGLSSGLLWATCNVGADNPEDYGDYFAWGETQPKDTYTWSTYQHCMGSSHTLTKYCSNSNYGYNGFTDNLTTLLPEDDAATANWGDGWRMPTKEEYQELYNNTTMTWTTQNGVNGRLFTASNGNSLFLPAAGYRYGSSLDRAGSDGYYWSSSRGTDNTLGAWALSFFSDGYGMYDDYRYYGHSVRPVRSSGQNNAPSGAIDGLFSVSATQQVYFSQGNLQYQASTNTWKFAENQWDYVGTQNPSYGNSGGTVTGSDNISISSTYSGWIDLFGWGTSGWNNGNTYYQPWSSAGYEESNYGQLYGPPGLYNLTGSYANADWGVYNPISNGGNTANQWRTLTQPEWNYVFNTRTTTSGIRYAKANVNNVNGVILLPDDWSESTYTLNNTNNSGASFNSNVITALQWTTLESAGAVFLPAAGYRYGASVYDVGSGGLYWSASCYGNGYGRGHALGVGFAVLDLDTDTFDYRYYGQSVRLVRVAEN